jgi:hypothetical protein
MPLFLAPIDLSKLELQNAAIQNLAVAPTTPTTGQIYFDTALSKLRIWGGAAWLDVVFSTSSGVAKTYTTNTHAATTSIAITHNLTSQNIDLVVRRISDNKRVEVDWVATTASVVTATFAVAPTANAMSFSVFAV